LKRYLVFTGFGGKVRDSEDYGFTLVGVVKQLARVLGESSSVVSGRRVQLPL
jgi:hypothetical protein